MYTSCKSEHFSKKLGGLVLLINEVDILGD